MTRAGRFDSSPFLTCVSIGSSGAWETSSTCAGGWEESAEVPPPERVQAVVQPEEDLPGSVPEHRDPGPVPQMRFQSPAQKQTHP